MDIMLILQIIVLFGGIYLGVKLGGMGVGYAGGLGVVILALLGMKVDMKDIPMDVILIIASVISAITALQVAGGLDYLVQVATKILRKNPKQINFLAPIVTYFLTILAGTGHTAFSMIPVIVEVAKTQNIKPSAPLALSVVSSQVAITASPISAAFVAMSGLCEKLGVSYPVLLFICISTTFVAMIITAFIINKFYDLDLSKDPIYQDRLAKGLVAEVKDVEYHEPKPYAKRSVAIFAVGVLIVVCYALCISKSLNGHLDAIKEVAKDFVTQYPFILAVALYFLSCLLYSQAATTKVMMPAVAAALGMTSPENSGQIWILVASFAAVSGLFVLPTYPTTLGAIAMDDTGTTRVGKFVFNHSFFIPGTIMVALSVILGFIVAPVLI